MQAPAIAVASCGQLIIIKTFFAVSFKTEFAKILREQTGRKLTNIRQFIINFNLRQHRNKHYNNKSYIQIQASNSAPLGFYYVEEVTK